MALVFLLELANSLFLVYASTEVALGNTPRGTFNTYISISPPFFFLNASFSYCCSSSNTCVIVHLASSCTYSVIKDNKTIDTTAYFYPRGGWEFEAYPLPFSKLGSPTLYVLFTYVFVCSLV
jgi:hypothetical protein